MSPQDELRTAARTLRTVAFACGGETWEVDHHPEGTVVHVGGHSIFRLHAVGERRPSGTPCVSAENGAWIALAGPALAGLWADALDRAAEDFDMCERINSRDPESDGKTRVMLHGLVGPLLAVAREINARSAVVSSARRTET